MKKILIITTIALLVLTVSLATLWYTRATPEDYKTGPGNYGGGKYRAYSRNYVEERGSCPLHGLPLQEDTVPIVYGLLANRVAYRIVRVQEFPCSNFFIEGGCVVKSAKEAKVFFCPLCRHAEKAWYKKYISENNLEMF